MRNSLRWIPLLRPHAPCTHAGFDLNGMIVFLRDASYHCPIPLVSVAPSCEDRRGTFERYVFGCCYLVATHISSDHEVTHFVIDDAVGYIRQNRVEAIQLCAAGFVLNNTPVLAEASEIKVADNKRMHNERSTAGRWGQLLEVWNLLICLTICIWWRERGERSKD